MTFLFNVNCFSRPLSEWKFLTFLSREFVVAWLAKESSNWYHYFLHFAIPFPSTTKYTKHIFKIHYYFTPLRVFHTSVNWWFFNWNLSDSKSLHFSRILFNILADLYNAVIWNVWSCHLNFKSSCPFTSPLGIVLSAPFTIGITVNLMFPSFLVF